MSNTSHYILIAEDDQFLSKILGEKFVKEGYEVILAANGKQVLEKAKKNPPALVILDLIMPVMDGFDVLTEMKKTPELANIPVIVATNLEQDSDEKKCRELGAADYFVKANTPLQEIVEKVRKYL